MKLDDILPGDTFKAKAEIPRPGAKPFPVQMTYKHRTGPELREWTLAAVNGSDDELVYDVAEGWDLTDEFSRENVKRLCDSCPGAGAAIVTAYVTELSGRRVA